MAKNDWVFNEIVRPVDANSIGNEINTIKSEKTAQDSIISDIQGSMVKVDGTQPPNANTIPSNSLQGIPTTKIINLKQFIVDTLYPIGSVVFLYNEQNPSTLFGGTWVKFGDGRFVRSSGGGVSATTTGGSNSVTLNQNNLPSHTHTVGISASGTHTHNVTGNALTNPSLTGEIRNMATQTSTVGVTGTGVCSDKIYGASRGYATNSTDSGSDAIEIDLTHSHMVSGSALSSGSHTHDTSVSSVGSGTSVNITNQYIALNMWRRTA